MEIKWLPWTYQLFDLRLTCRTIYQKTRDVFAKAAFTSMSVHLDTHGLNRLKGVSQSPALAQKVHRISLWQYDRIVDEELSDAEKAASSSELSRQERRDARSLIRQEGFEQDDKDFINRCVT